MRVAVLCLLLFLLVGRAIPQSTFIQTVQGPSSTDAPYIEELCLTNDTGMLLFGYQFDQTPLESGLLIKLNSNGLIQWTKSVSLGNGFDLYSHGFQKSNGNIYASGLSMALGPNSDVIVSEFNASGIHSWTKNLTCQAPTSSFMDKVVVHETGSSSLMVVASVLDSVQDGWLVAKLDASGNMVWSKIIRDTVGYSGLTTRDMVARNSNSFLTIGIRNLIQQEAVVVETDSMGNLLWQKVFYDPNIFLDVCNIQPTLDGGSIVGGKYIDLNVGLPEFLLLKLDAVGAIQWCYRYGSNMISPTKGACLNVIQAPDGSYLANAAITDGTNSLAYPSMIRFDQSGNVIWAKCYKINGDVFGFAYSKPALTADNAIVSAYSYFNPQSVNAISILKTNLAGAGVCLDSSYTLTKTAVAVSEIQPLETALFGGQATYTYPSSELYYQSNYICFSGVGWSEEGVPEISIFPNPASEQIKLEFNQALHHGKLRIINTVGQCVIELTNLTGADHIVDIRSLAEGVYYVVISDNNKIQTFKFIKI